MEPENPNEGYRECLRNHAASLGSYATDGCCEYTADESSPSGLQCAACGCHRNFHRKVTVGRNSIGGAEGGSGLVMGFGGSHNLTAESTETDRTGKKRLRTKFSSDQKENMMRFAEKIGWKMQRKDHEEEIARFCSEVGVSRQVFKVWMHNHKNSSSSSSSTTGNVSPTQ